MRFGVVLPIQDVQEPLDVLLESLTPTDVVARLAGRARSAAAAAGRPVAIGMFRDGWIGDSREACEKLWLPHALAVHRLYLALRMRQPGGPGHEATLTALARFGEEVIGPMGEGAQ